MVSLTRKLISGAPRKISEAASTCMMKKVKAQKMQAPRASSRAGTRRWLASYRQAPAERPMTTML